MMRTRGRPPRPGGGLPGAAISARAAIRQLCKDEGKKFVALEPR